jgi:hypothetical protein
MKTARRAGRRCAWLLIACASAACSSIPPLANAQPSAEALAREVLAAFERRDVAALEALALSEREFRDYVWPELPAARPGRNLPFSYVWGELRQKSAQHLARTLAHSGARTYRLVDLAHAGSTSQYGSYLVHRGAVITARGAEGEALQLRLYGSTFERAGAFKVFSYVVDE